MLRKLFSFLVILAVLGGAAYFGYEAVVQRKINLNHWFVGGQIRGVDVSSYQKNVDFAKLKEQGMTFAYIKATEGGSHIDESFREKWTAASAAGVLAGAYHYFRYNVSGAEQAKNFISVVGDKLDGRLIPAVDMELSPAEAKNPPEKESVVMALKAFLAALEEKYGVKPLIYAQKDYWEKYLADDFGGYPRWVRNVYYPVWVDVGNDWAVWQYDDRGELEGYEGERYVDLNIVNGQGGLEAITYRK